MNNGIKMQVKTFDDVTTDNATQCNDFLKEIGGKVMTVNTVYNTILGGVVYIVLYFDS